MILVNIMAKKMNKKMLKIIGIFVLVVAVSGATVGAVFGVRYIMNLQSTIATTAEDSYDIEFVDYYTGEDEASVSTAWYTYDVSEIEAEDYTDVVEALSFSDFTSRGSHTSWEIETDEDDLEIVVLKASKTGFETRFFTDESILADGLMDSLIAGDNVIRMLNTTEDFSMAAYSMEGVTFADTDDREWSVAIYCLDAAEGTGVKTNKEGVMPFYDFENGYANSFALRIEFNTTADLGWCTYTGSQSVIETSNGNYTYYLFNDDVFTGESALKFKLGATLGTDFEAVKVSIGRYSATYAQWDEQV